MDTPSAICTKESSSRNIHFDAIEPDLTRNSHEPGGGGGGGEDYDSSDSLETASDEIPVWIQGEQRWISGVNEETTCADLVNVLLADEGISPGSSIGKDFVITERWRRVEQILDDETKILQIWSAWGQAKSEVKLTLRHLCSDPLTYRWTKPTNDEDSGMGSPNGSITNSAIIRRRRHRASKSTSAWVTHAQTIHPKSQKSTIEKLVKLILEQGETIQHQLAKLRDREFEIEKIEVERHKVREREHGKNYLLETYLNGLHEAVGEEQEQARAEEEEEEEEEKELITANSDSGVQTEGATSSPEVSSCIQENETYGKSKDYKKYKEKPSHREKKLLKDHKNTKEFSSLLTECRADHDRDVEDISAKIEWMEKLIVINKHLQREEELLVRLGAKIRKYELQDPALNERQVRDALVRVNEGIDSSNKEIKRIENELIISQDTLQEKTSLLDMLSMELMNVTSISASKFDLLEEDTTTLPDTKSILKVNELAGNLYSFSQYISKPNYDFNEMNENRDQKMYTRHSPDDDFQSPAAAPPSATTTAKYPIYAIDASTPDVLGFNHYMAEAIIKKVPSSSTIIASVNSLHKTDTTNLNSNVYSTTYSSGKLGPKKMISELESNSDTGVSSLEDDFIHMGTLV